VNANQTGEQLPPDTETEPTSLRLELGEPVDRAALLAAILSCVEQAYDAWIATAPLDGAA
jgi:biotin-(acetyl-CoA carboxylase) ligase